MKINKFATFSLCFLLISTSCTILQYNQENTTNTPFAILSIDPQSQEDLDLLSNFIQTNPNTEDAFVALQRYIKPEIDAKNYEGALAKINKFEKYFQNNSSKISKLKRILQEKPEKVPQVALPNQLNTSNDEYSPIISIDGKRLFFVRIDSPNSYGGEDIFYSDIENGNYSTSKNIGVPINTYSHEALTSISADGTELCIFGNYPCNFEDGNLYYSKLSNKGWSAPIPFPEPINSNRWDGDGYFTSDGKAIIFTSDRLGGTPPFTPKDTKYHGSTWGNTDLYVCEKHGKGWSKPINLGTVINTPFAERKPYLHPDGKTLYFSSEGHAGLGGLDVFVAKRLDENSWTKWSEPVNLSKEINSCNDDWGYKISTDGTQAIFSKEVVENGKINMDIFTLNLPQEAKPEQVFTVSGKVTDEKGNPLEADLIWEDVNSGKQIGNLKSNVNTGEYYLVIPFGKKLGYYASKEGYYETSNFLDLSAEKQKTDNVKQDIVLVSIKKMIEEGQSVRMNNIFFDYDKYELKEESFPELERLLKILNNNKSVKIQISAHTDDQGSDIYNKKLSENRAQAVVDYLAAKGIERDRLKAVGYGESKPIADNTTEEGRAQNRRVEFKFIK
ncbi:MAG: hypothetical protein A2X64_04535 [Ignavibacteria bacterium GWF2_33_9]|nr:MAG: hypothetical protein A2X64_04535 [Ignavibacteria bacterium GWF2_33_9]